MALHARPARLAILEPHVLIALLDISTIMVFALAANLSVHSVMPVLLEVPAARVPRGILAPLADPARIYTMLHQLLP